LVPSRNQPVVINLFRGSQQCVPFGVSVTIADEFDDIFDGFSIYSNDLTQLILGVDHDIVWEWRK